MNAIKKLAAMVVLVTLAFCTSRIALGVETADSPAMVLEAKYVSTGTLAEIFEMVTRMGGASSVLKISGLLTLLIATLKTSALKPAWEKLGPAKVLMAPLLALAAGIVGLGANGAPITPALVFAYLAAGSGAIILHQLLDALKEVPGLGPVYVSAIEVVERALGGSEVNPQSQDKA